jgi:predicted negative regulator of RcsB-dependent stress response
MKEILLTSRQRMLAPDQLAFELNLIETPQEFERNKTIQYILVGGILMAGLVICYNLYQMHQEENPQKSIN